MLAPPVRASCLRPCMYCWRRTCTSTLATGSPSSSSTRPAITPCGVRRMARSLDFWPGSRVSRVPGLLGPRAPYWVMMKPLRSAESRYLPGAIPVMANWPRGVGGGGIADLDVGHAGRHIDAPQGDDGAAHRFAGGGIRYLAADGTGIAGFGLGRQRERNRRSAPIQRMLSGWHTFGVGTGAIIARRWCQDSRSRKRAETTPSTGLTPSRSRKLICTAPCTRHGAFPMYSMAAGADMRSTR